MNYTVMTEYRAIRSNPATEMLPVPKPVARASRRNRSL